MKKLTPVSAAVGIILVMTIAVSSSVLLRSQATSDLASEVTPNPVSTPILPTEPLANGWAGILGETSAPSGWRVFPCDNPILLCIETNGELIGTVERFSYPLSDVTLSTAIELDEGKEIEFLRAWVAEHYNAIERDRLIGYGNATFLSKEPQEIQIGSLPGLRYGYQITHSNGTVIDDAIAYVTTDGEQIHVFVTGVISQEPTGSIANPLALTEFEPHLDLIMQELLL